MPRAFPLEILHFLWKYCISFGNIIKKNIKLPLLKNLHLPTKKNRNSSVFYGRIKTKTVLDP